MAPYQQINNYLSNHYEGMDPKQLILLLYKGAADRLRLTREGIEKKDIRKKGENLGKAIAIITELNASLDSSMEDESTEFLRGLYGSILLELSRVPLSNDIEVLKQAERYMLKLKDIWENDVMKDKKPGKKTPAATPYPEPGAASAKTFSSIAV